MYKREEFYSKQKVQKLSLTDNLPRADLARWYLCQNATNLDLGAHILFTEECTFPNEGIYSSEAVQPREVTAPRFSVSLQNLHCDRATKS